LKADTKVPLELYEARNAVSIARSIGAATFATDSFQKAEKSLAAAEAYHARNAGKKPVIMTSREAVQTAEDARAIAVKRQEELILAVERQASLDRENRAESAKAAAQSETERIARQAEAARLQALADSDRLTREKNAQAATAAADAERARADADRAKRDSDARLAQAALAADRAKFNNEAALAAAKTESDRLKLESDNRANAAKADADRDRAASQAALDAAAKQVAQLEAQKAALRTQLLAQFNSILQTEDTARGLIVNMNDVLFDTAKSTLRPLAREKLAKVAGIVSGHPGLKLDVEGHTDSVGTDEYNQTLSEQRGTSVRDYLTGQGMAAASVTSKGFGESQPIASNDTVPGRQQNRRVELVISGEVIGTRIGSPTAAR
jgi:outer membrane protein OmpA-like peptidoglycan-associated protein